MSSETKHCSVCNAPLPADAPGGHCTACLLQLGLAANLMGPSPEKTLKPGDFIGRYRLIEQIGEGGCGVVFKAEQIEPVRREIALKVIKPGMDTQKVIARFQAEWQALALLGHPNIARIFDAGTTESGRAYFVMELVDGMKITDHCDRHRLSTRQRLELFTQVCRAVEHAHQKGIIHRDLKPSNILVTKSDDGIGAPKIIDFGIAKSTAQPLTEETLTTAFQQFLGTPAYMSPEQAAFGQFDLDTRSDIYSLGALLYELLTGLAPFDAAELRRYAFDEILRLVREKEPPRPSARLTRLAPERLTTLSHCRQSVPAKLPRLLRGDLDFVVMKCLEKDRARRYETASALAADLERHIQNEPVTARPPGNWYRFQKLARRNRVAFAFSAVILLTFLLGGIGSMIEAIRARRAESVAQTQRHLAETQAKNESEIVDYLSQIIQETRPDVAPGSNTILLRQAVDSAAERIETNLANQPDLQATLECTLAQTYHELGLDDKTEMLARDALKHAQHSNETNELAARALSELGVALTHLNELDEAETVTRNALTMREQLLGETNSSVSASLNNLGLIMLARNQFTNAENLFRRSLDIDRAILNPNHPKIAASLGNLGTALYDEQRYVDAEDAFRECIAMRKQLYGARHPDIAVALNNLSAVLTAEQRYAEAETMLRVAIDMDREYLGTDHPELARALNNLGEILERESKHDEALTAHREADYIAKLRKKDTAPNLKKETW